MRRHVTVNSKYPFNGDPNSTQLQFPANAPISINSKQHPQNGWLMGSYQGQKGWFPASYVDYRSPPPRSAPPLPPVYETCEFGVDEERSPRSITTTISINGISSNENSPRSSPECSFPVATPESVSGFVDQPSKLHSSLHQNKDPALMTANERTNITTAANNNINRAEIPTSTENSCINHDYNNIEASTSSDFNTDNVLGGDYSSTARPNEKPLPDPTTQRRYARGDEWLNTNHDNNDKRGEKPWASTGNIFGKIKKMESSKDEQYQKSATINVSAYTIRKRT